MASYEELLDYYQRNVPGGMEGQGTSEYGDRFNHWTGDIMADLGVGDWSEIPLAELDNYEYIGPPPPSAPVPLEQGLANQVLPRLIDDATTGDAARGTIAQNLANQALSAGQGASKILQRTQGGGFDGRTYFAQNPDVAAAYAAGAAEHPEVTMDAYAETHYLKDGQREGRQPAYIQSPQLAQDFANADRTTTANIAASNQAFQTNLAALQSASTAMQQNLTGNLATRATALGQQIATLGQNLDQLDATQRKALTDSIAAQQANLEQAIATQRQALQTEIAALGSAATTEAQARRAALQQELAGLTAAQEPVAQARLQAAELQATAVNVGLQRTTDQLTAEQAAQGYVGGSTIGDAALARATVDARQRSAEALGAARFANASDTRDIGVRGATGTRSIADALAEANRQIATTGATGEFALSAGGANERRRLGDTGAVGNQNLTNQTALSRAGIGAMGADRQFQDQVFGADQQRSLGDALAQGTFGLTAANSANTLGANQAGNAARATYHDQDFARSLNGALGLTQIPGQLTQTLTGLDNYANSGLARTLQNLNWWSTNQATPPTPGFMPVQPGTSGNDTANLGAGLVRLGGSIGQSNNWWAAPKKTTPAGGITTTDPDGWGDY